MTIYKASLPARDAWCRFMTATQGFTVMDDTNTPINKHKVFHELYNEQDVHNTQIELLISNIHGHYHLVTKPSYNMELLQQQHIEEVQTAVLKDRAVKQLRRDGVPETFDDIVQAMVKSMSYVMEEHRNIEKIVKERV